MKRFWWLAAVLALVGAVAVARDDADDETKPDEVARTETNLFHPPVRLTAADGVINHGEVWGHCGPWFEDVNGDGKKDLLVGDFSGHFTLYKNTGSNTEPKFAKGEKLMAGGVPAHVHIY